MLELFWSKFLNDLKNKAERSAKKESDLEIIEVCEAIEEIPPEIKTYVLMCFRKQMQKLSWIFLYHTRTQDRPDDCNHEVI